MNWSDEGVVLSARRHGETSRIVELLTKEHGRHLGLVRGGASRRFGATLQPGNTLRAQWRGRLSEHLGTYTLEPIKTRAASIMSDASALAGLNAVCALASLCLPEREPHGALYEGLTILLDLMDDPEIWPVIYARWELGVLNELGFGLDLSHCAATGSVENLSYVSPKSGRAVSEEAAPPYRKQLFLLPTFLKGQEKTLNAPITDVLEALRMTGFFLERRILRPHDSELPGARHRLIDRLEKMT
jgi:DNA repair protein RecO (recombination protein O)